MSSVAGRLIGKEMKKEGEYIHMSMIEVRHKRPYDLR